MEKEEGKDYFGYKGQAESYQNYRPQYPKEFIDQVLSRDTLPNLKKKEVCIDIGTGTGFLAKHMASEFKWSIGTDLSEVQLRQAAESHKDTENLSFKLLDVRELREFQAKEGLNGDQVDLYTIGQALHWFDDISGTLRTVNSVLREDSYFTVFGYSIPRILDGSDLLGRISREQKDKGFTVIQDSYSFDKDQCVNEKLSSAYNEFWKEIYPHFRYDRSVIEDFYQPFPFAENLSILAKIIWLDVTRNKPIRDVLGYLETESGYRCYLDDRVIQKGSELDPLEILRAKFADLGNPDLDFMTPYFCIALGKKE